MVSPVGVRRSGFYPVSRCLPLGGFLSPLRCPAPFGPVAAELVGRRPLETTEGVAYGDISCLDDVTMTISCGVSRRPETWPSGSHRAQISLIFCGGESRDLVFHPYLLPERIYRRTSPLRYLNAGNRAEGQYRQVATPLPEIADFPPSQKLLQAEENSRGGIPFPASSTIRILCATAYMSFASDEH